MIRRGEEPILNDCTEERVILTPFRALHGQPTGEHVFR